MTGFSRQSTACYMQRISMWQFHCSSFYVWNETSSWTNTFTIWERNFFPLFYFPCVMRFYYRLSGFLSRKEISRRLQSRRCYHVGSLLVSSKTMISRWCHVVWLKPLEQWSWSEPLYGASFSGDPGVSSRQNVSLCFTGAVWRSAQKHIWQLVGCRICRITESDWFAFGAPLLMWRVYFSTPGSWIHSKSYPPCGGSRLPEAVHAPSGGVWTPSRHINPPVETVYQAVETGANTWKIWEMDEEL